VLAALLAGILFRRNLAAEIVLFSGRESPATVGDWFSLLQSDRLLTLVYLNVFDLVNYALLALMFLALYVALRRAQKSYMAIAMALGLLGIGVYLASNTAFSILSLSDQHAGATTEAQRSRLLAAGEALLALNRFSAPGAHPGSGGYVSLLLVAVASMMAACIMVRSDLFNRVTAYLGIVAGAVDLAYAIGYAFVPAVDSELLALLFIPAGGLLWMVWHILVGWQLYRLGMGPRGSFTPNQAP
jgi:hypothetical protein